MNSLNYLKSILITLKPEELHSLEKFVLYNAEPEESYKSKTAQLIRLLLEPENYSANDIQKTIYGKVNYAAFNKLVNRLKEKTLEVLLFNSNLQRGYYSNRSRTVFELRKRMIQIDLLILKGVRQNILNEIDLTIKKATQFEIYDILVQVLYTKQRFQGLDMGIKSAGRIKEQISTAEMKWTAINSAQAKFNELISKISVSSSSDSYKKELTNGLSFLKKTYEETSAPTIGYYYLLLLVEKAQIGREYLLAGKYLMDLQILVENSKSVYSEYRMGSTTLNIANNNIFLKNLHGSLDKIIVSKKYFINQPLNMSILNELEFYNLFYLGEKAKAENSLKSLVKYSRSLNSPFLLNKRIFYEACMEFINNKFINALSIFKDCEEIDKDKEGWNIIKRIMITLCRIELEEYESVDLKLSNLDKFIKRLLKTKNIRPRYLLIIRILRKLINENFNYAKVYSNRKKYFELLESDDADYTWEIKSPELVVFEEWFKFKIAKRNYDHSEVMRNKFEKSHKKD